MISWDGKYRTQIQEPILKIICVHPRSSAAKLFLELLQEAQVVFVKEAQVVNAEFDHR
jgi:hypothetical protein